MAKDTPTSTLDPDLRLDRVLAYLDECDAKLLAELKLSRDVLHQPPPHGWTVAQAAHHLILAEKVMLPIWRVVPKLGRWPTFLQMMDRANSVLWRTLGMRTIEAADGRLTPANAGAGRFRTPGFLDPRPQPIEYNRLVEWRGSVRAQTLRAVRRLDEGTLKRFAWTLPHSGQYSLIELVRFIGIHEMHHLPQIRRVRELV